MERYIRPNTCRLDYGDGRLHNLSKLPLRLRTSLERRLAEATSPVDRLRVLMERAERIRRQQPKDPHKLYALHAPEVECISKGKARQPSLRDRERCESERVE